MTALGARLVVAGTSSGVGKTTVATGLLAALRRAGHRPAGAKVGPDFIDPGYHALACGRPPRNLDAWLCGAGAMAPLAGRASAGAGVLVVEGVMGLFDGSSDGTASSTADVARLLEAPVVLVVDASAMSASVAAMVHGYASFEPAVRVGGVILNQVGSDGHEVLLREALAPIGIPVLGALHRDDRLRWRDRHLGLVPVAEEPARAAAALDRLADLVAGRVDLAAVMALARSAPSRATGEVALPAPGAPTTVAVAGGAAFTFTYTDTVEALEAAGARTVVFDPLHEPALPEGVDGVIIGGGFPEVFAPALADNRPLLRQLAATDVPLWAECGGLLLLGQEIDGHRMAGVVPARATMTGRLTLGYRTATTLAETPLGPVGTVLRGHEFHYSQLEPAGPALRLASRWGERQEGYGGSRLMATYLHYHPGGDPAPVGSFVRSCALHRALRRARKP
ncbi:MAG: cobyrinate a,c-diamide synthase [Actinomycetota bacterium]|nr:cobyrinate a,c-diamide synthase [Actinomycetota bacterium]